MNNNFHNKQQLCGSTAAAVAAASDTVSSAARGGRSLTSRFVVEKQPYVNSQFYSNSARMVRHDTVHNRNGVRVGKYLYCGRKNKASGCRCAPLMTKMSRPKSGKIRMHDQAEA